jgi:hypothetical protein
MAMAATNRGPVVNPGGAAPVRFQLYAEDVDALREMQSAQVALGESSPSQAKIVRAAIRELRKRDPEQLKGLLAQTP